MVGRAGGGRVMLRQCRRGGGWRSGGARFLWWLRTSLPSLLFLGFDNEVEWDEKPRKMVEFLIP